MATYDMVELDTLEGPMKKVRKALGVAAFGVNYGNLGPGQEGHEHDETRSSQEEVYVFVEGAGVLRLDGNEVPVRKGVAVRMDAEVRRQPVAGENGLAWVAVGSPVSSRYEPPSWG